MEPINYRCKWEFYILSCWRNCAVANSYLLKFRCKIGWGIFSEKLFRNGILWCEGRDISFGISGNTGSDRLRVVISGRGSGSMKLYKGGEQTLNIGYKEILFKIKQLSYYNRQLSEAMTGIASINIKLIGKQV